MNLVNVLISIALILLVGVAVLAWAAVSRRRVDRLAAHEDTRPAMPEARVRPKDGPGPYRPK